MCRPPCLAHMSTSMSASQPPTYAAAAALAPVSPARPPLSAARTPPDSDLAAFWDIFKLGARRDLLNAYFGLESVDDLEDVHLADIRTIAFAGWAERHLTVVEKNRLRRAVNHYHVQIRTAPDLYSSPVGVHSVASAILQSAV